MSHRETACVLGSLPQAGIAVQVAGAAQTTLSSNATAEPKVPTMLAPSAEPLARIPEADLVFARRFFFPVPAA